MASQCTHTHERKVPVSQSNRGVTMPELLAVLAIISILAGITYVSLSYVREHSRLVSAENIMETIRSSAVACIARGQALSDRVENQPMCGTNSVRWPRLPNGWVYDDPTNDSASDPVARTFSLSISGDGATVTCTEVECTTS